MEAQPLEAAIRRCTYRDLDVILPIYNHYASQTVVSLDRDTQSTTNMRQLYDAVLDADLPFLVVAVSDRDVAAHGEEHLVGFAYARPFDPLPAYSSTVEVLVYLDPQATGRGIGEKLLMLLMDMLKAIPPSIKRRHGIREVMALVPVDEGRDPSAFFLKMGFEQRGLLKRVARKTGSRIDVRYLQSSFRGQSEVEDKAVQERRGSERERRELERREPKLERRELEQEKSEPERERREPERERREPERERREPEQERREPEQEKREPEQQRRTQEQEGRESEGRWWSSIFRCRQGRARQT